MRSLRNRLAEIKVAVEYLDVNDDVYEAICYVTINSNYEVEDVRISFVEVFNSKGEVIQVDIPKIVRNQIESMASTKALEKVQAEDFNRESERE